MAQSHYTDIVIGELKMINDTIRMIKFQTPPDQYDTMNYIDPNFPDGSVAKAKNYCRNPDGTGLHCYKSGNVRGECASLIKPCEKCSNCINSLTPGRYVSNFQSKLFKHTTE